MSVFPTGLPTWSDKDPNHTLDAADHTAHHNQLADEVEAIAAKIGVNNSAVPGTLDYRLATVETGLTQAAAYSLKTTGANVIIGTSSPPSAGQILIATSATAASWQTPLQRYSNETVTGTQNGSNTAFTAQRAYVAGTLEVWLNGIYQRRGVDFTESNPGTGAFTLSPAPTANQNIRVSYHGGTVLTLASDANTVGGKAASELAPVGVIQMFAGSTAPAGWLLCAGQTVSRSTYADLFAVIGTQFNTGGEAGTDFRLPNLLGKVPVGLDAAQTEFNTLGKTGGAKTHTLTTNEMPNHNHGAVHQNEALGGNWTGGSQKNAFSQSHGINTNTSNTGGGAAHNNLQPYISLNFIIKAT